MAFLLTSRLSSLALDSPGDECNQTNSYEGGGARS